MALKDNSVLLMGEVHFFIADVGTPVEDVSWVEIGHTKIDEAFEVQSEGGDKTVLGTRQKKALRTSRTPFEDSFRIQLQQFDEASLKLYFGANSASEHGMVGPSSTPEPTQKAFKAEAKDLGNTFRLYCPKADLLRGDTWSAGDGEEEFASLPIDVTPLMHDSNKAAYYISPIGS